MKKNQITSVTLFAAICLTPSFSRAGVRHSRSLGGTGQSIPKGDARNPTGSEQQAIPYNPALQNQLPIQFPAQGEQPFAQPPLPTQGQPQNTGHTPAAEQSQTNPSQVAPYQPLVVPPPVPVQIPTQMSFEPPIQVPPQASPTQGNSQGTAQNPLPSPAQNPLPASPLNQMPSAAPAPAENSGMTPAPVANPSISPIPDQIPVVAPSPAQNPLAAPAPLTLPPPQQSAQPLPPQGIPSLPPMSAAGAMSERYVQPSYGMAGCGLGSMIFKDNVRSDQWIASIINDLVIPQSIVITTGTSNCVDLDEEQMQAEQEIFIDTNLHALRLESARGEGENLRAFADLLGCRKDGLFDAFASSSQGQHTFIFSDSQPAAIAERYREVLKRSRALKARCDRLF